MVGLAGLGRSRWILSTLSPASGSLWFDRKFIRNYDSFRASEDAAQVAATLIEEIFHSFMP
ncbi:MAG: hypothetical protein ACRD5G_05385 [Candidatus Acidiferrales bacterium]